MNALVLAMKFWDKAPRCCPTLARLSAEQWKKHIQSNHADYQRDCLACVMGRGTGRRHARVRHPDMFSLTVDIAGPVKPGLDVSSKGTMGKGLRYMMVAKYTFPTEYVKGYTGRAPPGDHGLDLGQDQNQQKEFQPDKEIAGPSQLQPHEGGGLQQPGEVGKEFQPDQEIARPSLPQPHEGGWPIFDELEQSRGDPFDIDELEQSRGDLPLDRDEQHLQVTGDQYALDGFVGSSRKQQQEYEDFEDSMMRRKKIVIRMAPVILLNTTLVRLYKTVRHRSQPTCCLQDH